jgi:hypothetical protein
MSSLGDALKGLDYLRGHDPNIDMMVERYDELLKEEETVKKRGHAIHGYCWKCKKFRNKLKYRICANGHLTYWCYPCYRVEEFMNGNLEI